jgi:VIT1/CCC1 family predicted Fe2+/Mn2+ transporter
MHMIAVVTLVSLGVLGALGAKISGAPIQRAVLRVVGGGALAMAVTAALGQLLGAALG